MKHFKRFYKVLALVLTLSVFSPQVLPVSTVAVAEAATIKLDKKSLTLETGKSYTLKISGTKAKATWSSGKKSVATVNKSGKVTAVKEGKAVITATVNKKKYTCNVTVKKPESTSAKAPFKTQEIKVANIKGLIPKDWTNFVLYDEDGQTISLIYPSSADFTGNSNLTLAIVYTGEKAPSFEEIKDQFENGDGEETFLGELSALGEDTSISDLKFDKYDNKVGTGMKISYNVTLDVSGALTIKQVVYGVFVDNYFYVVAVSDDGTKVTPNIYTAAEYLVNSLKSAK